MSEPEVNVYLLDHQFRLLESKSRKVCMICGRGAGKSYALSVLALNTLFGETANVMVGGQRYETLHDTLYAEIKKRAQEWGVYDLIKWRESPMQMEYNGHYVYFGTYESVDAARGYSEVELLLLDEMFLAPIDILSIWAPCMRGAAVKNPRIVGATTPRMDSLWNVMMSAPECDWEIIRATTRDNVYISDDQYNLILSGIQSDDMRRQELEGVMVTNRASHVFTLSDFPTFSAMTKDTRVIGGFDGADGVERDYTAFFKRQGNKVLEMWELNGIDHEEAVRRIRESHKAVPFDKINMDHANTDYEYTVLKYEINCEQVNFARSPSEENKEKYANVRAEMFFNGAHVVKHGLCVDGFEKTGELKRQLCAIGWHRNNQNRLLLTKKEDLRAALGRSPDIADAFALTCLDRWTGDDPLMVADRVVSGVTAAEEEQIMSEY
jgi:hypothetical protein